MLVTIRQTKSSGQNLFQVEEQGQLLFQAQTPWADLRLPLEAEKMRRLTFSDAQGQPLYHTSYQLLDNILRSLTKYKFLLGTSAKVEEYQVLDETGQQQGSFYTQIDGVFTSQLTICYGEEQYDCYPRSIGKIYVVSIFQEGRQIAQITKPLAIWAFSTFFSPTPLLPQEFTQQMEEEGYLLSQPILTYTGTEEAWEASKDGCYVQFFPFPKKIRPVLPLSCCKAIGMKPKGRSKAAPPLLPNIHSGNPLSTKTSSMFIPALRTRFF